MTTIQKLGIQLPAPQAINGGEAVAYAMGQIDPEVVAAYPITPSLGFGFTWRSIPYTATIVDQVAPQNKRDYSGNLDLTTIGLSGMWNVLKGKVTEFIHI